MEEKVTRKRVTLKDVAAHVGVGTTTISDILLRNKTNYSESMMKRVRDGAKELGYVPNQMAQNFRRGFSKTIGVLVSFDVSNPFFKNILTSIEHHLEAAGYMMHVVISNQDSDKNQKAIKMFESGCVDGIIAGPIYMRESMYSRLDNYISTLPSVFFICEESDNLYTVNNYEDNSLSPTLALNHLLELGHRKIGYLMCPNSAKNYADKLINPYAVFRRTLTKLEIFNEAWVWVEPNANVQNGYILMKNILNSTPKTELPTAFVVHNDYSAIGIMAAIHERGYKVPDDFSIVSHDGIEFAEYTNPPLTTVNKYPHLIAQKAVELLINLLENPNAPETHITIKKELVVRGSTSLHIS